MTIGKAKFLFERYRNNLGILNSFLLIYLTVVTKPIWWGWFALGFVASIVYLWIDMKYIYPKEAELYSQKNPSWLKMMQELKEIKQLLEKKRV